MSKLIDQLVYEQTQSLNQTEINGKWYIAKPIGIMKPWWVRLREAWKVLCGELQTYYYKEDEINWVETAWKRCLNIKK